MLKNQYFCIQFLCFLRLYSTISERAAVPLAQHLTMQNIIPSIGHRPFALLLLALLGAGASAQDYSGYGYLNLPISARALALGGTLVSDVEPELPLAEQNPSLLCPQMAGQVALCYSRYLGDIHMGYVGYASRFLSEGAWSVGMRYVDYGQFSGYDEQGIATGSFGVKDLSFQLALGYPINDRWRVGAQTKFLYSSYESYNAFALGVDVGLNYYNEATGNSMSLTAVNMGGQFRALYEGRSESMPTQVHAGWSRELQHLPFCITVTACNLLDWDYPALEHFIFGLEWAASDYFWLGASYNYHHQRQFSGQGGFLRGVALGAGVSYKQLSVQVAYASAHAGNGTLTLQLGYAF